MQRRLKVLVSAYACEPDRGSEPGTGWNVVRQLARAHDLVVVTRSCYRRAIEDAVSRVGESAAAARFVYLDLPAPWEDVIDRPFVGENVHYALWQWLLRRVARSLHERERFDVAHHVTFVRYWMPPGLAWLPDVPVVFGPVGGADEAPPALHRTLSVRGRTFEYLRRTVRRTFSTAPGLRYAVGRSAVALATTPATAAELRALGARDVRIMSEAHVAEADVHPKCTATAPAAARTNVVCVGRLIEWKAYHLAIAAWARADVPGLLEVFGDGAARSRLTRIAREHGVADRVRFHGTQPRARVLEALRQARMLVHPSLHDSGGWAVLEAMQHGVPVVCWDHAGPGRQVDAHSGRAVPIDGLAADTAVDDMAAAIRLLATDEAVWERLACGARARVLEALTWERHGAELSALYHEVLALAPAGRVAGARPLARSR